MEKRPIQNAVLTKREMDMFLSTFNTKIAKKTGKARNPSHFMYRVLFELLIDTGMRRCEIVKIKLSDIVWEDNFIGITGKKDATRELHFSPRTKVWLKEWLKYRPTEHYRPGEEDYLFVKCFRQPYGKLSVWTLSHMMEIHRNKAGLSNRFRLHNIRRTTATDLMDEGFKLNEVSQLLGHKNIYTTSYYIEKPSHNWQKKRWASENGPAGSSADGPLVSETTGSGNSSVRVGGEGSEEQKILQLLRSLSPEELSVLAKCANALIS